MYDYRLRNHVVVLYLICYKQYHLELLMQIQTKLEYFLTIWCLGPIPPSQKSEYQLIF